MKKTGGVKLADTLPVVVALVGDEERAKERLLAEVIKRAGSDASLLSWSPESGDRPEAELSRLLSDLGSRPLFGGRKVIVARDGEALLKRAGKGLEAALDTAAGNQLVIMLRSLDSRTRFAKKLKKEGGLYKCERPRGDLSGLDARGGTPAGNELIQAVLAEARLFGLEIKPNVALELAGRTGNDLMLVASEMEKLKLFLGKRNEIRAADVEAVVPRSAGWDQFQLFQEVATGNVRAALKRLRGMFQQGTVDRGGRRVTDGRTIGASLVALLHNRIKLLARYRLLTRRGVEGDELRKSLGVRNPGQLYYLGKEVQLPLVAAAENAILVLAEADRALKSSQPPFTTIERLVVRLAGLAGKSRGQARGGARR